MTTTKRIPRIRTHEIHESDGKLGYLGCMLVDNDRIYACGGTYHKATLLVSDDGGRSFRKLAHPPTPGLRRLEKVDGTLYLTGEYGMLAASVDSGLTWTQLPVDTETCLFVLHRGPDGTWWVIGDGGVILRSPDGVAYQQVESDWDTRLLEIVTIGGTVHICGYDGTIRKWTGSSFEALSLEADAALTSLHETRAGTWLTVGDGGIAYRSTDKGETWTEIALATSNDLESIIELPVGIYVCGNDGTLLFSDDDAQSFVEVPNDMTGHLWSFARFGDALLVGADDGQIFAVEVLAGQTMEVELPDEDEDDEEEAEEAEEEASDDAAEQAAGARFDSPEQASERWIREGQAFYDGLNAYVRRCYEVGPNKAGEEPSETRQDMAGYVLEQLVALNQAGDHRRARQLFPPWYEPFDYDALGQQIDQVAYLADGRIVAAVGAQVYTLGRERIVPVTGVMMFAQSPDRRYVAKGYADRVDIHDGWDGPKVRSLPALSGGCESATVAPDGTAVLVAGDDGAHWLSEAGARRLLPEDADRSVHYPHAAMSPNGRFVAMGLQDTPHIVIDRKTGRRYHFDPVSSYPNFAAFHADRPEVVLSSCHGLYGSASQVVDLDRLVTAKPEQARVLDRRSWVRAVASTRSGYILGDRGGYLWAFDVGGDQQWYTFLGSTLTAMDGTPDGKRVVVGSYAGIIVELDLTGEPSDPRLLSNGPGRDVQRWLFWRGYDPMLW